jgi:hypothetical protein
MEDLRHGAHLARSKRVRPLAMWLVTALLSTVTGAIGWIASKVDTLHDMQAIRTDLQAIRTAQDAQTRAVRELLGDDPPGRLVRVERGQRYVLRAVLEARTAAYAGEPAKLRAAKAQAADDKGDAYDRRVSQGKSPLEAYDEIVSQVAVP